MLLQYLQMRCKNKFRLDEMEEWTVGKCTTSSPPVNEYRGFASMATWESRENIKQSDPWFLGDEGSRRHSVNTTEERPSWLPYVSRTDRRSKSSFPQNGEKNLLPRNIIFMLNRVATVPKNLVMLYPNQHQLPARNPRPCVTRARGRRNRTPRNNNWQCCNNKQYKALCCNIFHRVHKRIAKGHVDELNAISPQRE